MKKFDFDFSYVGVLKENLCEPLYMYLGFLCVYCDKEEDCFEKLISILNKYKNMDTYTIDYLIKLILFYIKRRLNKSVDDKIVKQIENVINNYSSFVECFSTKLNEAFELVDSISESGNDFSTTLKQTLSKFFEHFGCSFDDSIDYKKIYDEINIDDVPLVASVSEKNGLFGENKIYFFDNQFLIDMDIVLGSDSLIPYDRVRNDIIMNILMHIGYLYLNSDEMKKGDKYLKLGELLENIDDVVEMFLIKIVNLYIAFNVTNRKNNSDSCNHGIKFIEKKFKLYGFDVEQIMDDVNQVCDEFVSQGNFRMLDIYCERILYKFFSYFGLEGRIPKVSEIAGLYIDLGFNFDGITEWYSSVGVVDVDMKTKIPFIEPEKYDDDYKYKKIPSFFGVDCTYVDLASKAGLDSSQILEKSLQLCDMLRYYDVGITSVYGVLFPSIWCSGHGMYFKEHGFDIYRFLFHEIFMFFKRVKNKENDRKRKRDEKGA